MLASIVPCSHVCLWNTMSSMIFTEHSPVPPPTPPLPALPTVPLLTLLLLLLLVPRAPDDVAADRAANDDDALFCDMTTHSVFTPK